MCYKIESTFALIHYLKNKKSCTVKDIFEKKRMIEKKISSVYIDVSRRAILQSISSYPKIFTWNDGHIEKHCSASHYFKAPYIHCFDCNVDADIQTQIATLLEN